MPFTEMWRGQTFHNGKMLGNKSGKPDYFFIKKYYTQTIVLFVYLRIKIEFGSGIFILSHLNLPSKTSEYNYYADSVKNVWV